MKHIAISLVLLGTLTGCLGSGNAPITLRLRVAPPSYPVLSLPFPPYRDVVPVSALEHDCYLVSVHAEDIASSLGNTALPHGITPACAGLGTLSSLVSAETLTGEGLSLSVPRGSARVIRLLGVAGKPSCGGSDLPALMTPLVPRMHVLGSGTRDLTENTTVTLTNVYSDASPQEILAPCADPPEVEAISPDSTPVSMPASLTITGRNFLPGATVKIGDLDCGSVLVTSSTELTCGAPPHGTVESLDVRVTNRGGKSGTRAGGFTYFASFIENWVFIEKDTPDLQGINFNPVDSAAEPVLVSFDNALWAFWHETVGGTNTIFAAKFNGDIENPAWPLQDDDTPGWNANSALDAESPQAVVHEDRLYLMWLENNRVRVARYDASNPSLRVFIDAGGLNDSGKPAVHPRITVYDGRLYAAWTQLESGAYQVRLAKFDETSWSFVSGHEDALNLFPSGSADSPDLVVLGADLYITWSESDGSRYRGLIKKYNATTGLFTSVASYADEWSTDARSPRLAVWEGELYVTWLQQEDTSPYRGSWVAKLNGSSWTLYNYSGTTEGFNSGPANALQPRLLSTYGKLYLTLAEDTGSLHVYQWDGTLWAPAYDTSSGGIQWNGGGLDSRDLSLAAFGGRIYASWSQLDSTTNRQIRIAVGMPSP